MNKQILTYILLAGFLLGVRGGKVALWRDQDPRPVQIYDIRVDSLPLADREALEAGEPAVLAAHRLPDGFINERVNMSDWEGDACIGGVFNGSCWSETSNLLTLAEVYPYLPGTDT